MLAANGCRCQSRLATLLRPGTLGLHRCRLVLALGLFVGRNHVPLWAVVCASVLGLVLVAGHGLVLSWVNWRYSGAYCGWAPLPPMACYDAGFGFSYYGSSVGISFGFGLGVSAYTFVPWGNFCGARPYQHRVPPQHASQVYNNSTVINNYGRGNNNTVINRGISPEHVRAYSRTEVRIVHIRDQVANGPAASGSNGMAARLRCIVRN